MEVEGKYVFGKPSLPERFGNSNPKFSQGEISVNNSERVWYMSIIQLSNNAAQTIPVGGQVTFNTTILKSGCSIGQRANSGTVNINGQSGISGIFEIGFSANVGGPTAATAVELTIQYDGANLNETTMISVPATATTEFNSVSTTTFIEIGNSCCATAQITVVNTGTTDIIIDANPTLYVRRIG